MESFLGHPIQPPWPLCEVDNDVTGKEVRDSPVSQSVRIESRTKALVLTVAKVKPSREQIGAGRKKKKPKTWNNPS